MVTGMLKLTMRQIRSSLTRFLAIAAIVALGVGFFCGLRLTKTAMVHTLDDYAEAHRMYDFRLVSTVGFDETDAEALAADARVAACEGEKSADALASVADGAAKPCRFLSLPEQIDLPGLKCGRFPQTAEECLADGLLYSEKDLGKTVVLTEENDEDTLDSFNRREFTIVGIAKSVLYINYERGGTSIGSGTLSSFVYILPEAFALEYDTSLYLRLAGRQGEVYSDEYTACIDAAEPWVTQLAESAAYGRSDRLYEEAEQTLSDARETLDEKQQELADAKQELADAKQELEDAHQTYADGVVSLADAKQEAEQELADGEQELADALTELADGEAEYADGYQEYLDGKAEAEEEIADAYQKLVDGQRTIEENEQKLADGEQELADGEKKLADAKQTYEENAAKFEKEKKQAENEMSFAFAKLQKARETLAEQQQQLDAQKAALDKQEAQIDAAVSAGAMSPEAAEAAKAQIAAARGQLAAAQAQLDEGKNALADNENQLDLAADAANEAFAENQKKLDEAKKTLEEKQQELEDAKQELEDGRQELEDAKQELKDGWADYYTGKAEAEQKISDAEQELADAKQEITDGDQKLADAEQELADGEQKLADAEQDYRDGEDELEKLENPDVFVLDRSSNVGYACFESDSDIVRGVSRVFPLFFFAVAALVCITTMTRMVDEQRTQAGVLKALGYSNGAILSQYFLYAGIASVLGCVLGIAAGSYFLPKMIWHAYNIMYGFTGILYAFDWPLALVSSGAYLLCALGTTWYVVHAELQKPAAELIRPRAPKAGKRILLERLPLLWNRLPFLHKVSIRNILRFKKRMVMMMIGIGGCTALLITGFGIQDSISSVVDYQYDEITRYDAAVTFQHALSGSERGDFLAVCEKSGAEGCLFVAEKSLDASVGGTVKTTNVVCPESGSVDGFIDLHTQEKTPIPYPQDDGCIISRGLAQALRLSAGDTITLQTGDMRRTELTVEAVFENYVYNYVYLTQTTWQDVFGEAPGYEAAWVNYQTDEDAQAASAALTGAKNAAAVTLSRDFRSRVATMMQSLRYIVLVVVLGAAALAFIVLYNLTNINITEREREIATIKVLGFYDGETNRYVFRENIILTVLGALVGLPMGKLLHAYVMGQIKIDLMCFDVRVAPLSYLISAALTLVFGLLVNLALRRKIRTIDMSQALKSIE